MEGLFWFCVMVVGIGLWIKIYKYLDTGVWPSDEKDTTLEEKIRKQKELDSFITVVRKDTNQKLPDIVYSTTFADSKNHEPVFSAEPKLKDNMWTIEHNNKHVDPSSNWGKIRQKVFSKDNFACRNCGDSKNLTVQHKVPLSLGGSNAINNLITLCAYCHEEADEHIIFTSSRDFDDTDDYGKNPRINHKVKEISHHLKAGKDIFIKYKDAEGHITHRLITPIFLHYDGNRIYLRAFCKLRDAERTFRISRMTIKNK